MAEITTAYDTDELHQLAVQLANDEMPDGWEHVSRSSVARVAVNRQDQLYYKQYLRRSVAHSIKSLVRGSPATRARVNADALLLMGIDAPETIYCGILPDGREYMFAAVAGGEAVSHWLDDQVAKRTPEQLRLRRQMLQALGTFIGRVHANGFIHGDLRPDHVLVALRQEQFHFTLVANERNVRKAPTPGRMLLRNLRQLNLLPPTVLSRTDRMRFFRAWRHQMRELSPVEAKILAEAAYGSATEQLHSTRE